MIGQIVAGSLFNLRWGPVSGGDSGRYLSGAASLPSLEPVDAAHIGYVTFLRVGIFLGSPEWFAVVAQSLIVIGAAVALRTTTSRVGGEMAGWMAALVYLLHLPIAQWTRYVLTEPIFYAGLIFTTSALMSLHHFGPSPRRWAQLAVSVVIVCTVRPNGILLLVAVVGVVSYWFIDLWRWRAIAIGGALALTGVIFLLHPGLSQDLHGEENALVNRLEAGEIFWKDSSRIVVMPTRESSEVSLGELVSYVTSHPVPVAQLAGLRIGWEAMQMRPWYSAGLNFYLFVTMSIFHILAVIGAWKTRRSPVTLVIVCLTLPSVALIGLSWAVQDGRFGWWFLTLWIIWVGVGAKSVLERIVPGFARNRQPLR